MAVRRRPGEVRDAIVNYLKERRAEASMSEIQQAVASRLGGQVPPSSVRSYLRLNAHTLFERTGRGECRLRHG
jgi:hypothetical protein